MSLSLSMNVQFNTTIEKLWSALTDPDKLAKWIADNDFQPEVGHRFQFRHEPNEYWDGIVESEVLAIEEPRLLKLSWAVGEERHTVTLTIEDLDDGKVQLHLEQTGFSNEYGQAGAKHGWADWFRKLEQVVAD